MHLIGRCASLPPKIAPLHAVCPVRLAAATTPSTMAAHTKKTLTELVAQARPISTRAILLVLVRHVKSRRRTSLRRV